VIVDAFSTGALLAPVFKQLDFLMIHIQTSNHIAQRLIRSFVPTDFDHCLTYETHTIHEVLNLLQKFSIICVVPGQESGVILADELALHLGIQKNNAEKTLARRSKYFMHEALKVEHLLSAEQIKSASIDEILKWYREQTFQKVVVKPEYAASSEGVTFCKNETEVIRAFQTTIDTKNFCGIINDELVVQEYLSGDEFIVNTMSVNGEHFITDIWLGVDEDEEKISADLYARLLHPEEENYTALSDYVKKVLSCVGLNTGPAHVEVRCTPKGPALIEIGARLSGTLSPKACQFATGFNPIELAVDTYVRPERAVQMLRQGRGALRHAKLVYFCSNTAGTILHQPDLTPLYALPSVQDMMIMVRKGDYLLKTSEVAGRPGFAYLVHDDPEKLEQDYKQFLKLEQALYQSMLRPDRAVSNALKTDY